MQNTTLFDNIFKDKLRIRLVENDDGYFVELIEYFDGMKTDNAIVTRFDIFDDAITDLYNMVRLLRETRDDNPPIIPKPQI